jgi:hypothetical protein
LRVCKRGSDEILKLKKFVRCVFGREEGGWGGEVKKTVEGKGSINSVEL